MRIFDETKTFELSPETLDYTKGYLKPDKKFVIHHEAVEAQEAVYMDRVEHLINGSTQVWKDLVTPAVEAKEAYDEYEDVQVYVLYTEEELKEQLRTRRTNILKAFDTYKANVKYGIEYETEQQHEYIIAWYNDLKDLRETAFETIPERIKYYL